MSFPRYPAYKYSGIEWLGNMPAHWGVMSLVRDIEFITSGARGWAENYSDDGDLFIRIGNLTRDSIRLDLSDVQRVVVPASAEVDRTQVQAGDVLFSITAYLGSVAVVPPDLGRAFVSQHVALVRLKQRHCIPAWIGYVAISHVGKTHLETTGYGGTKVQLSLADVTTMPVLAPPKDEQLQLVGFLDRETAKIDALVAEQEQLITLLKEKRQAVISHAVTKGLDPSVPMKDSGVEWLGAVPEHWSVQPLGALARAIQTGPFGSQLHSDEYVDDATPVINPSNIIDGQLFPEPSATVTNEVVERLSYHKLVAGDIVVGRRGEMGRCAVVLQSQVGWLCGTGCLKIQLNQAAFPEFVWRYLSTEIVKQYLSLQSVGSTMENLNTQILARVPVPVPPASEQAAICKAVLDELILMSALESEAIAGVQLLQERRSALISAAVTGQIDVLGLARAQAQAA